MSQYEKHVYIRRRGAQEDRGGKGGSEGRKDEMTAGIVAVTCSLTRK